MSEIRSTIAALLAEGVSLAEIARRLDVAAATVGYHAGVLRREPALAAPAAEPPPAVAHVRTRQAVAELLAAGISKYEIAQRLGVSKSTVSYHARRIGAEVDERGARRYDWAAIQAFYDEGRSARECQRAFGFASETWRSALKRGAIETRPRTMPLGELCRKGVPRNRIHLRRRLVAAGLLEERCAECGLTKWCGRPAPLELDHINGDRYDHQLENLRLLCPNCHAQTDTYAGRRRVD